jgi:hypothetical protein
MATAKTNAVRLLDRLGIRYELRTYDVDPDDLAAETIAQKIGMSPDQVFKTLVARGDKHDGPGGRFSVRGSGGGPREDSRSVAGPHDGPPGNLRLTSCHRRRTVWAGQEVEDRRLRWSPRRRRESQ